MRVTAISSLPVVLFWASGLARAGVAVEPFVVTGQQAPGLEEGVAFAPDLGFGVVNDAGQVLFTSRLDGPGIHSGNDTALFLRSSSGIQLLIREGGSAPGFAREVAFEEVFGGGLSAAQPVDVSALVALNNNGRFVFAAEISGPGLEYPATLGIWTGTSRETLELFLQGGQAGPPGFPGTTFGDATFGFNLLGRDAPDFNPRAELRLDDANRISLEAYLEGPRALDYPTRDGWNGTAAVLTGWLHDGVDGLTSVVRVGDPIPGTNEVLGPLNWVFADVCMNDQRQFGVRCFITFNGETGHDGTSPFAFRWTTAREAILLVDPEEGVRLLAASGFPAPGTEETFGGLIRDLALSDDGLFLFRGFLGGISTADGEDAIWWGTSSENPSLLFRAGDQAPGAAEGAVFSRFTAPSVSDDEVFVFGALLTGEGVDASNDGGLWMGTSRDDVRVVLREGAQAPGLPGYLFGFPGFHFNDRAQLVVSSRLTGPGRPRSWWAYKREEGLELMIREGDVLRDAANFRRVVLLESSLGRLSEFSRGNDGRPRRFAAPGALAFGVRFATGGRQGIAIATIDGCAPETPDTVPPIITHPSTIDLTTESPTGATVEFHAVARDNCDPAPALTCTPESGSVFSHGTTTVTCTAMDASGNRSVSVFDVTLRCALERDCNENCVDDSLEVSGEAPRDCNGNGVPDSCDVVSTVEFEPTSGLRFNAEGALSSLVTGDWNADGRLDLAAALGGAGGVAVALGSGDGAFGEARLFSTGEGPRQLAVGDLDGDGDLDLVTASSSDVEQLSLLLGRGDGTFEDRRSLELESFREESLAGVATGDFDGNGATDIASTVNAAGSSSERGELVVLLADGDGKLQPPRRFPGGEEARELVAAHLDEDGVVDLASRHARHVVAFCGNGDGTFRVRTVRSGGGFTAAIAAADLNQDGLSELVVTDRTFNRVTVYQGQVERPYADVRHVPLADRPHAVVIADFDRDGLRDAVTSGLQAAFFLRGRKDGTFREAVDLSVGGGAGGVVAEDFDDDGLMDLAASRLEGVTVLLNRSAPFSADLNADLVPDECEFGRQKPGDCNQDGSLDLSDGTCILASLFQGEPAPGCGERPPAGTEGASGAPESALLALTDFNGDGEIDISDAISLAQHLFLSGPAHPLGSQCVSMMGCNDSCAE